MCHFADAVHAARLHMVQWLAVSGGVRRLSGSSAKMKRPHPLPDMPSALTGRLSARPARVSASSMMSQVHQRAFWSKEASRQLQACASQKAPPGARARCNSLANQAKLRSMAIAQAATMSRSVRVSRRQGRLAYQRRQGRVQDPACASGTA